MHQSQFGVEILKKRLVKTKAQSCQLQYPEKSPEFWADFQITKNITN
jgi:hypothetical protein